MKRGSLSCAIALGVLAPLLLAAAPVRAELLEIDSEFGVGTITRDTDTLLDWLDLSVTKTRTVVDIVAQLEPGGEFEGFRYATTGEISALWLAHGVPDITFVGPIDGSDWTAANFDGASALAQLFEITITLPGGPVSEGFTNEAPDGSPNLRIVGELNLCSNPMGCPIVGALTGTALASLGPNQKDAQTSYSFLGHYLVRARPDGDGDGTPDDSDNCTLVANADQRDTNADGFGNVCDPDVTNDCTVNFGDLGSLKAVFFTGDPDNDYNGDGAVNFGDLGTMKAYFFQAPGPSGVPNGCEAR